METVILNGRRAQIVEKRISLPNVGLGPSTATVGHSAVYLDPDPAPVIFMKKLGRVYYGGKLKQSWTPCQRLADGSTLNLGGTILTSPRTTYAQALAQYQGSDE